MREARGFAIGAQAKFKGECIAEYALARKPAVSERR